MKVFQLLNKFWHGASSIHHVYLRSAAGHQIELTAQDLSHPGGKEVPHYEEMRGNVNSFRVEGDSFIIYC